MLVTQLVASQTKIFPDTVPEPEKSIKRIRIFKNEPASFQAAYRICRAGTYLPISAEIKVVRGNELPISAYKLSYVPVTRTDFGFDEVASDKRGVGLYPDMLVPRPCVPEIVSNSKGNIIYREKDVDEQLSASSDCTHALWFTVNLNGEAIDAGEYEVCLTIRSLATNETVSESRLIIEVVDLLLPKCDIIYTNWFYSDCIARFYDIDVYGERFFEIFYEHVKNAAEHSMNTLLLPAFTPPLDTPVGEERMDTALVSVKKQDEKYIFDFKMLEKYVRIAQSAGIEYFEHAPMYSQWGAGHAPNIYADVDEKRQLIFGWDTDSDGDEYKSFLLQYISALKPELEKLGIEKKIIYHVSDEPNKDTLESFKPAAEYFYSLIGDSMCIDALSEVEYYKRGLVRTPVVALDQADSFVEVGADIMLYYTCGYYAGGYLNKCTNRLITSKPYRTRMLGTQLYSYSAKGFLHWGYNYYFDRMSVGLFDPKIDPCGYKQMPGCSYLMYPAKDGRAFPSVREKYMSEAFCDYRALKLLESLKGREAVLDLCNEYFGERVSVTTIPKSGDDILSFRESVLNEILKSIEKS